VAARTKKLAVQLFSKLITHIHPKISAAVR
jgi:hypothetical protein